MADLDAVRIALARCAAFVRAHSTKGHSPACVGARAPGGCPEGRPCEARRMLAEIEAAAEIAGKGGA